MDLGKKIAILFLLLTIGISTKMIIDKEVNTDTPEISGQSSSWLYRKSIEIENDTNRILPEKDFVLTIDTEKLISSGKLQPNCNDIRFLDEDNATPLLYHIEEKREQQGGCNNKETKIQIKILSIKPQGKTIYLLYGNSSAPNLESK